MNLFTKIKRFLFGKKPKIDTKSIDNTQVQVGGDGSNQIQIYIGSGPNNIKKCTTDELIEAYTESE